MKLLTLGIFIFSCFFSVSEEKNYSDAGMDYLIQKLKKQNRTIPTNHPSKKAVHLRLAHMLSVRAEKYIAQDCELCLKKGSQDARRSLALYGQLDSYMKTRHVSLYALSLFERAYLNRLLNQKAQAISYLKRVLSLPVKPELLTRVYFNLGEVYFDSNKYASALKYFNLVSSKGKTQWAFQSSYKKIWSLYNLSRYKVATQSLESFLKSDFYNSKLQNSADQELKIKIQNELVTLYSRAPLSEKSINFLYEFKKSDPKKNVLQARNQRIFDLGTAFNRIGRVAQSNKVWAFYLDKENDPIKQLEAYIYVIDNHAYSGGSGFFKRAEQPLNKAFDLVSKIGACSQSICQISKSRLKKYMLENMDFENRELKNSFLAKYNSTYPNEFDMIFYQARLTKDLNQYEVAQKLFQKSVLAFKIESDLSKKDRDNLIQDKEKANILQIETAELTKNKENKLDAYNFYLTHGIDKDLMFKSEYQKAYLSYEDKKYQDSAKQFYKLALRDDVSSKKSNPLKVQAAHLAMTSLSFLKNDESIMEWSQHFSRVFPKQKKEFLKMRNTATLNVVRNLVSDRKFSSYPTKPSSNRNIKEAWETLLQVNLNYLNKKEKFNFYMNKILLAKELLLLKDAKDSIAKLSSKGLNQKDRKFILATQLWIAEAEFDFDHILKLVNAIKPKDHSKEHLIYLASLLELSGKNSFPIYEKIIKKYPESEEAFALAVRIVNADLKNKKTNALRKYQSQLIRKPDVLSYLVLKADQGNLNEKFITAFLKDKALSSSSLAQFVKRKQFIDSFKRSNKELESFSIPKKFSQRQLVYNLKKYKSLLKSLESRVNQSIELQDWTSQVMALSIAMREINRFYTSVMGLPLPKNLTPEEAQEYTGLLEKQMAPYKLRVENLSKKLDELWEHDYAKAYRVSYLKDKVFQKPVLWEIQKLEEVAPPKHKKVLDKIASKKIQGAPQVKISKKEISKTFDYVKSQPFNKSAIKKLIKLESKRKNEVMVFYLKSRLKKINGINYEKAQL